MNNDIYDDLEIEKIAKNEFGVSLDIKQTYVRNIPSGYTSHATVLLTDKKKLYVLVVDRGPMTLGDVRKIIMRMGLKAEAYLPPKGRRNYFQEIAEEKFKKVYPGRHDISEADIMFYRLMVPYNPALVCIEEITDGVIKQFDTTAATGWRPIIKAQYRHIKTA